MYELLYLIAAIAIAAPAFIGIACGGWAGFFVSLLYYAALALCVGAVLTAPVGALAGLLAATSIFGFVCWGLLDQPKPFAG